MPKRLGGLRSCASLASASRASLIHTGCRPLRHIRAMPPAYLGSKVYVRSCCRMGRSERRKFGVRRCFLEWRLGSCSRSRSGVVHELSSYFPLKKSP